MKVDQHCVFHNFDSRSVTVTVSKKLCSWLRDLDVVFAEVSVCRHGHKDIALNALFLYYNFVLPNLFSHIRIFELFIFIKQFHKS